MRLAATARPAGIIALIGLAAACSSSPAPVASGHRHRKYPTIPAVTPCPSPSTSGSTFPTGASSLVPHPGFATAPTYIPVTVRGVKLLQFSTSMSLSSAVLFVLKNYPAAGYDIGRGDAEAREADVPFVNGAVHGTTRLSEIDACTTTWLVATVDRANAPLTTVPQLAPHYSSSPKPFGSG